MKQYLDFSGKVAIITGARSGIGKATAVAYAEQGAKVVLAGRRACVETQEAIEELGGECMFVQCDVAKEEDVINLVSKTLEKYGRLDVAVNNAGVSARKVPLIEQTGDEFDRVFDTDAKGLFLCMKYEIEAMLKNGGGAIVNVASVAGLIADPMMAPYVGAKHAVVGMTKSAAIEYAGQGIRVNGIAPGFVDTEMTQQWSKDPEAKARVAGYNFQKRAADPSEIATVALFLGSDMASFMGGAVIPVEAGQTAH